MKNNYFLIMYNKITFSVLFLVGAFHVCGQTETIVRFVKSHGVSQAKWFRFYLLSQSDTIKVFSSAGGKLVKNSQTIIPAGKNAVTGVFEFTTDSIVWQKIEQQIAIEKELKRVEIDLIFTVQAGEIEMLEQFSIDKFFHIYSVSMQSVFKKEAGANPVFMLVNHSDSTFWGCSMTNHFYGTMKRKTKFGWHESSGSFCLSTMPAKPLLKNDTAYSWVPYYNPEDEYKLERNNRYKYSVAMGLERHGESIPLESFEQRKTRVRTRVFYELEAEFYVE